LARQSWLSRYCRLRSFMKIVDLAPDETIIRQAAAMLVQGFRTHWPNAWPDMDAAAQEVRAFLSGERICRVAIDSQTVLGWIGAISEYDGMSWELHPLVVHSDYRGRGIGRALVTDLEQRVWERGGVTLFLGTDDESDMTSLAGKDLYPDVLAQLAGIKNLKGHPYEFYQKVGFVLVGVIPDANGPGKPDILMAKRVGL
jgi:aminoglycoside 6'-N-acetyltransferase I